MTDMNKQPSKSKAGSEGICGLAVLVVVSVFMYLYGYTSPDKAGCWIGTTSTSTMGADGTITVLNSDERVVWPTSEHPYYNTDVFAITLEDAEDWGHKMTLWFRMGFFMYAIQALFMLIRMVGHCAEKKGLASCGSSVQCCAACFGIVWAILGAVWRWGENGTLASCYKMSCTDEKGEPDDLLGSGYQYKAGKFMNIYLWIWFACAALPLACCLICLPICCIFACCAAKK